MKYVEISFETINDKTLAKMIIYQNFQEYIFTTYLRYNSDNVLEPKKQMSNIRNLDIIHDSIVILQWEENLATNANASIIIAEEKR